MPAHIGWEKIGYVRERNERMKRTNGQAAER